MAQIFNLFCSIAWNFEIYAAHRRSLLQEAAAAAEDASRAAVHVESSDTMRSRKAQCQAPPGNPETGDTITVEKEAALARKVSTKTCTSSTAAVHHPPLRPLPPTRQSLGRVVFTVCESCTRPISTNPGSMEACEYWLTRGTCFRRTPSRSGRGRRAAVDFVVCCECGGISFFLLRTHTACCKY